MNQHPTAPPPYAPPPPAAPKRHVVRWVLLGLVAGAVLLFGGCSLLMVGAAAGSASHAPAPTATAPAQPSNPFLPNGDNGQAPTAPTVTAPGTYAAGTYEITAKPGGQWTITPGTYETNAGYGYALITKAADGQVGDPGYRMVAVNGHTIVQLKQSDVGKYVQFVGPADWTAKS